MIKFFYYQSTTVKHSAHLVFSQNVMSTNDVNFFPSIAGMVYPCGTCLRHTIAYAECHK